MMGNIKHGDDSETGMRLFLLICAAGTIAEMILITAMVAAPIS
jgi:hypothetical protein